MNTDKVHFGQLIESLVRNSGADIDSESRKWGFNRDNLYKTFKKRDVNTSMLRKACEVYGVNLSYFFGSAKSVSQVGNANIGGDGNATYNSNSHNADNHRMELLLNENEHLKAHNKILSEMVEILKSKT